MTNRFRMCKVCKTEYLALNVDAHQRCPTCRVLDALTRGKGDIRWFDRKRGYGFIQSTSGQEVFFHRSDLRFPARQAQPHVSVRYMIEHTDRGTQARQVHLSNRP